MEKNLNISEMVEEYTSTTNEVARKMFLDKIQVEPYISYSAKIIFANRIVQSTSWNEENNHVQVDSPIRYLLYVYTLLSAYTNIEVHKENMLAEYDALTSAGLKDLILQKIPQKERQEFDTVLKMVTDDYYMNHFETHAYINGIIDRFKNIMESFVGPISQDLVEGFNKLDVKEFQGAVVEAISNIGNQNKQEVN